MSNRFDYVAYDHQAVENQKIAKYLVSELESFICTKFPAGRAPSIALTKLEEVYMWIGKAIRDEQVQTRKAELQEVRNNE